MSRPPLSIRFVAAGNPVPQGSKRLGRSARTGRAIILDDPKMLKGWRTLVGIHALAARQRAGLRAPLDTPVTVEATFYLTQPRSVRGRPYPSVRPDLDKLLRACLDSLTQTLIEDDSQVIAVLAKKLYVTLDTPMQPGVVVVVRELRTSGSARLMVTDFE